MILTDYVKLFTSFAMPRTASPEEKTTNWTLFRSSQPPFAIFPAPKALTPMFNGRTHSLITPFLPYLEEIITFPPSDPEFQKLHFHSCLKFGAYPLFHNDKTFCDMPKDKSNTKVLLGFRQAMFDHLHSISHLGIQPSIKLVTDRFVWSIVREEIFKLGRVWLTLSTFWGSPQYRYPGWHFLCLMSFLKKFALIGLVLCIHPACLQICFLVLIVPLGGPMLILSGTFSLNQWYRSLRKHDFFLLRPVTTDRDSQLMSTLFCGLLWTLGCEHIITSVYRPASNGFRRSFSLSSERYHCDHTIRQVVGTVVIDFSRYPQRHQEGLAAHIGWTCLRHFSSSPSWNVQWYRARRPDSSYFSSHLKDHTRHFQPSPTRCVSLS